jgi:PAS domain S-box-containing protein
LGSVVADQENAPVPLEAILCTDELESRPARPIDYKKESSAFLALTRALADSPETILQALADTIRETLLCGSAGVSLLTKHDGGKRFYWPAISGIWKQHIGGGTPRDFGPCGNVLDLNKPLLMRDVERRYTYFEPVTPRVEEALLVPFYVDGKAVGTIWAVHHDNAKQFDSEDRRLLVSLSQFATAAYQAVNAIEASKQLAAIVESSDDAIISKGLDGTITSWNSGAERVFGYTAAEAIGRSILFIIPPNRRNEEAEIIERIRKGERVDHFETVRLRKDGAKLDISLTISPVKDAAGRVVGASKVARDVTERRRSERILEEQARLLDMSNDAIFIRDDADRITHWNRAARDLYGYTVEEAMGQVPHELLKTQFPMPLKDINKALHADDSWTGELIHTTKTGQQIIVMTRWVLDRKSYLNSWSILETNTDITQQKRIEKALRDSEERYRAIVETTPECVKLVAPDGTLLHMNLPGLAMLGASDSRMVLGRCVYDLIAPEHREKFQAFNERVCAGEKGTLEFDMISLNGVRRHMETHGAPLWEPEGTIVQLAVTRDITERKEAEESQKQAELSARLLQVQDTERRRIARELHDGVGQTLAAINMNISQVSRAQTNMSPATAQRMLDISKLVQQVSTEIRTVSYLLHPPLLDELGLAAALNWYVDGFAERSNIAATVQIPDGLETPREHALCLFRIAQECLTNIHRHSGSTTAAVKLWRAPGEIRMEISDTGRGIDQETTARVASGESKSVGLRGMRERVKLLRGTLEITSNGRGTSVLVTLPVVEEAAPPEKLDNKLEKAGSTESEIQPPPKQLA